MKLSLSWLNELVDLSDLSPDEVGRILTMGSAEVEGVTRDPETGEQVLEVDNKSLTHRPDLWGHVGIARELAALTDRPLRHPRPSAEPPLLKGEDDSGLEVVVEDPDLCPRYTALVIENVSSPRSPEWMARRLAACGVRPISALVDLTNYVMLELGQPLHAFDIGKLRGPKIIVRRAEAGETIVTLDDVERRLGPDDLLIADRDRGIALAGVMGSADSEIDGETTTMVLEAATFDPVCVRRTATRVGLRTEAVMRFEKSLDPALPIVAAGRFVELLTQVLPEARPLGPFHDSSPELGPPPVIELHTSFVSRRLGMEIPAERIDTMLRSLEFGVERVDREMARVTVPSFRATKDISIPEDLVEELGRIHGYDNIAPQAPAIVMQPQHRNELRSLERRVKTHLSSGLGFDEVYLYSFQSSRGIVRFELDASRLMPLANPLSEESQYLKRSLVPDLLLLLERNSGLDAFRLFEQGRAYVKEEPASPGPLPREERRVAGLLYDKEWREDHAAFLAMKGAVDGLLGRLGWPSADWSELSESERPEHPWAHPGRAAVLVVGAERLGIGAEVHPRVLEDLGVSGRAAYFDLDLEALMRVGPRAVAFEELARFPSITIDISVLCPERTPVRELLRLAREEGGELLRGLSVVTIYRGRGIPDDHKSVTLRLVFNHPERTLQDLEAHAARDSLMVQLRERGFEIR